MNSNLCLFFTERTGFIDWQNSGMLARELALYRALSTKLTNIYFVSYGNLIQEKAIAEPLGLSVLPVSFRKNYWFSVLGLLLKYRKILKRVAIFKSNQFPGAEIPYTLKKCLGGKFVLRAGFIPSFFWTKAGVAQSVVASQKKLEQKLMAGADSIIITSEWQKKILMDELQGDEAKIHVVPNYVETELFCPMPEVKPKHDLCFLGRDDAQKNLPALLEAMVILKKRGIDLSLRMIGSCTQPKWVCQFVQANQLAVQMDASVAHSLLPAIFNESKIFVMPSFYEGHPKALLEAMSTGRACIGADVPGIREEIADGVDGLLCQPDARSISEQIIRLLENESLAAQLGQKAREKIISRYRIDWVAEMEWRVLENLLKQAQ